MTAANLGNLNGPYGLEGDNRSQALATADLLRFDGGGVSEGGDKAHQRTTVNLGVHNNGNSREGDKRSQALASADL